MSSISARKHSQPMWGASELNDQRGHISFGTFSPLRWLIVVISVGALPGCPATTINQMIQEQARACLGEDWERGQLSDPLGDGLRCPHNAGAGSEGECPLQFTGQAHVRVFGTFAYQDQIVLTGSAKYRRRAILHGRHDCSNPPCSTKCEIRYIAEKLKGGWSLEFKLAQGAAVSQEAEREVAKLNRQAAGNLRTNDLWLLLREDHPDKLECDQPDPGLGSLKQQLEQELQEYDPGFPPSQPPAVGSP